MGKYLFLINMWFYIRFVLWLNIRIISSGLKVLNIFFECGLCLSNKGKKKNWNEIGVVMVEYIMVIGKNFIGWYFVIMVIEGC